MQFKYLYTLMKCAHNSCHQKIKEAGISHTEHFICTYLYSHPDSSQDDVAADLQMDKATIARALLSLESKGYIERCTNPKNRRKNLINISDFGRETTAEIIDVYDAWLEDLSRVLNPEEKARFAEYCLRLMEAAKEKNSEE
ncbi:MAG: winged helix-turn-helix transcriptional regulator [Eubacterium sp.]|nr:winged helix-turn-helix transcriptional regulator [Eubacterium sp.]